MKQGRPIKLKSPAELDDLIEKYLHKWEENPDIEEAPCIEGFSLFSGIGRSTLYDYEKKDSSFSDSVETLRKACILWLKNKSLFGKVNPTIAGRLLGAYGVKEVQEIKQDISGEGLSITIKKASDE